MRVIRFLLIPFALLYGLGTEVRNLLYNKGLAASFSFTIPVISVGNLTVGGTGKTPMIEYLIKKLAFQHHTIMLSRGYKRKTKGFKLAGVDDKASTIGDEPYQIYRKFHDHAGVAVGEDRALAITEILARVPDTKLILMDDAYQHRTVNPAMNILLTDFNRPFYKDYLLPVGNLRELRYQARRADVVLVSKCPPNLNATKMDLIEKEVNNYTKDNIPVYFTSLKYLEPKSVFNKTEFKSDNVYAFTGIASPDPFMKFLRNNYLVAGQRNFPDHFDFSGDVLQNKIVKPYRAMQNPDIALVCTEKDAARLVNNPDLERVLKGLPLFYVPVEVYFLRGEQTFLSMVKNKIDEIRVKTEEAES